MVFLATSLIFTTLPIPKRKLKAKLSTKRGANKPQLLNRQDKFERSKKLGSIASGGSPSRNSDNSLGPLYYITFTNNLAESGYHEDVKTH